MTARELKNRRVLRWCTKGEVTIYRNLFPISRIVKADKFYLRNYGLVSLTVKGTYDKKRINK